MSLDINILKMFSKNLSKTLVETGKLAGWRGFSSSKALSNQIRGLENEPEAPKMVTQMPGPKSKQLTAELGKIQVEILKNFFFYFF